MKSHEKNVAHASSLSKVAHASSVPLNTQGACSTFFNPYAPIDHSRRNLPHWYQEGAAYFVTFRLADSIPQQKLKEWIAERDRWLRHNPEPRTVEQQQEFAERFPDRLQEWLDAGMGSCRIGRPENGRIVAAAMQFFDGQRYHLGEWVVMPNHVHVIFQAIPPYGPEKILHSWKSYTGNEINRRESRCGPLWQKESYDHIVRSPSQLYHYERYIAENPRKAGIQVAHVPKAARAFSANGNTQDACTTSSVTHASSVPPKESSLTAE